VVTKAADQGDTEAQCCVAKLYMNGLGVVKSDLEAARWHKKAAEQGRADAQHNLGIACTRKALAYLRVT
jgi:TPR repeat protein